MRELIKGLKVLLLTFAAYLIQVCVMQYFSVAGVTGSVLFAWLAVLTVSYGKKYTFCASCLIGMLMESMLANVKGLYVIVYPAAAMLCAQLFADMSDSQRQKRRQQRANKRFRLPEYDLPVIVRIPCCAALMSLILNIVLCAYLYLIGVEITFLHVQRVVLSALYTSALALLLMKPLRRMLGMTPRKPAPIPGGEA